MTPDLDAIKGQVAWLRKPLHPNAPTLAFHDAADTIDALVVAYEALMEEKEALRRLVRGPFSNVSVTLIDSGEAQ